MQILIGIIPTFKLIKCGLSYSLKRDPRPFSECTKVCTSLSLTASKIDRLDIQLGTISPFNQDWISRQSMTASKMHFWRLSMIKWCKLVYILKMASDHVLGCSWGHIWIIWMKFSENVGMIPIKICYFLQFLFTWTN